MKKNGRWQNALPRPIAFVLSGGANLGAIQIGMLKALLKVGLQPDLVAGSSVGALNGAVVADRGLAGAIEALEALWMRLRRNDIFPGGRLAQARQLLATRLSLFPNNKLAELGCSMLTVDEFEQLRLPFGALATELLTGHGALFTSGALHPALLASAALPGAYPPIEINGTLYIDGGVTAVVPMSSAIQMGAKALVVLDAGELCHRLEPPRHIAELIITTMSTALRQRVRVEAPLIAATHPVLYLPTPCPLSPTALNFGETAALVEQAEEMATAFLENAAIPTAAKMSGAPHFHDDVPIYTLTSVTRA